MQKKLGAHLDLKSRGIVKQREIFNNIRITLKLICPLCTINKYQDILETICSFSIYWILVLRERERCAFFNSFLKINFYATLGALYVLIIDFVNNGLKKKEKKSKVPKSSLIIAVWNLFAEKFSYVLFHGNLIFTWERCDNNAQSFVRMRS